MYCACVTLPLIFCRQTIFKLTLLLSFTQDLLRKNHLNTQEHMMILWDDLPTPIHNIQGTRDRWQQQTCKGTEETKTFWSLRSWSLASPRLTHQRISSMGRCLELQLSPVAPLTRPPASVLCSQSHPPWDSAHSPPGCVLCNILSAGLWKAWFHTAVWIVYLVKDGCVLTVMFLTSVPRVVWGGPVAFPRLDPKSAFTPSIPLSSVPEMLSTSCRREDHGQTWWQGMGNCKCSGSTFYRITLDTFLKEI